MELILLNPRKLSNVAPDDPDLQDKVDRLDTMKAQRSMGWTLAAIAQHHGISAPRVSVLLNKAARLKPASRDTEFNKVRTGRDNG